MIPKKLHYVWLGGALPEEHKSYIKAWRRRMPEWEICAWNEHNFDLSRSEYAREAYKTGKFGFVSDYIRVCVLAEQGGVYLDTDVELLRPLDGLLGHDLFLGFENDAYVGTAVLGSAPAHPLLLAMKNFYERNAFLKKGKPDLTPNPFHFTLLLHRDWGLPLQSGRYHLNAAGWEVAVYPREVFSPIDFNSRIDMRTAETYTVHHFANSWAGRILRAEEKFLAGVRKVFGRKIFSAFTRAYTKSVLQKLQKSL